MGFGWILAAVVVVGVVLGSGYGFLEEDLVVKLQGQPEVKFRQYAGYLDVDLKAGRSLFYYFVEAEEDPDHKPLTLWLNGVMVGFNWRTWRRPFPSMPKFWEVGTASWDS
ncbi:Serine carboxypeptidase-like 41 [Abeliophyllum distichum]|uniref:Serine carboxypeptidase-like 41 n=1 Tax=Abeliophyllum distichum TaxID=126358 RepID=A0ABD1PDF7_9LAMI